jgi:adenine-specific DNA-methyltransferase
MARLEDLIGQVNDPALQADLRLEVKILKDRTRFGLVFERHIPETVIMAADGGLRVGDQVRLRHEPDGDLRRVISLNGSKAGVADGDGEEQLLPIADLLIVRQFGDPIFPKLTPLGRVERGGDRPYHAVINGENYHALQLLEYAAEAQVDCIYIDPPYNTGARDWKYNNDYVDANDRWRHSKWLAMMERRLRLAKRLLRPDGVLICTIDEHEVHHLALLLERLFAGYERYMVTIVNAPQGNDSANFSRVEEHAFFCVPPSEEDLIQGSPVDFVPESDEIEADLDDEEDYEEEPAEDHYLSSGELAERFVSENARRRGNQSLRRDREKMFFPIYIDEERREIATAGPPIPLDEDPSFELVDGLRPVWPIDSNGDHRRWRWGYERMLALIEQGEIRLGRYNAKRDTWAINRVQPVTDVELKKHKTVWRHTSHNAGTHGSGLLSKFLGQGQAFSFPKSVYATRDCIAAVCRSRPDALIVDFFGGSGTTLHSTLLLNQADLGRRRCIVVTNNEVEDKVAGQLARRNVTPGTEEWERHGIFNLACKPRCEAAITGKRPDGQPVPGKYLDGRQHSDGFEENCEFFQIDFLDPDEVELGRRFPDLHPLLWLATGARGARPVELDQSQPFAIVESAGYAVLFEETALREFIVSLNDTEGVDHLFLVTASDDAYAEMCEELGRTFTTHQLYREYLETFRGAARY